MTRYSDGISSAYTINATIACQSNLSLCTLIAMTRGLSHTQRKVVSISGSCALTTAVAALRYALKEESRFANHPSWLTSLITASDTQCHFFAYCYCRLSFISRTLRTSVAHTIISHFDQSIIALSCGKSSRSGSCYVQISYDIHWHFILPESF